MSEEAKEGGRQPEEREWGAGGRVSSTLHVSRCCRSAGGFGGLRTWLHGRHSSATIISTHTEPPALLSPLRCQCRRDVGLSHLA